MMRGSNFAFLAIYNSGQDIHEIKRSKLIDGFTLCPNWELSIDLKLLPPVDNQSFWRNILRIRKPGPQSSNSLDEKIAIGERLTPFLEFKRISFVHLHSQFLFIYVLLQRKMLWRFKKRRYQAFGIFMMLVPTGSVWD